MNPFENNICELLAELPVNQEIQAIVVDIHEQLVSRLIDVVEDKNLAYLLTPAGAIYVADCRRISSVTFP